MKNFRARMTIMIVCAVMGMSVFLSIISYQRAKSSLMLQLENNYGVTAQKYALELTSWFNTNATIIDTIAAEIAVNGITEKSYDEFHKYMIRSNDLLNKNGYVYDVYFTYPDNFMVCASDFLADGTVDFVHEREWYTKPALTGELFYATPYSDSDTGRSIITISKAVYKEDKLLGVLAADIFVDVIVEMIRTADVEKNSYAFIVDQNMNMITHPNNEYNYKDSPHHVMGIPNAPYGPLVDAINSGNDKMVFVKDFDGATRGIVFSKMPNTGWYVCIATDVDEIEKGGAALTRGFVVATLVSVLVGLIISIILTWALDRQSKQEQEYQERVFKLEKMAADKASEAKSRFLADMSHEIRTPINAIIGLNEMILRETDSREIRDYSVNIKQSGLNLLHLINGILDFSKIEDGKMEIVPIRYSLRLQILYFINSISERAEAKGLELVFNIDESLPSELFGDDARINQVVMNLLTNAVKYTESGTVTLSIEGREKTDDGRIRMYFEVKDTGIGIREEDMKKLFESFERLDVIRNRNIEGTGLGMNITVKLLELMGSSLNVESIYGIGSVFSFELWQKIENDEPIGDYRKAVGDNPAETKYKESFKAPSAKILLVDDNSMNIFVVQNLLKKTGVLIDTAQSGPDSIKLAKKNKYDVILMDQRMPKMDGTEAMKKIRDLPERMNADTPVICLTADAVGGAKERYLNLGFDDYLTKPVDGAELEKTLLEYIP
ncbi:MAG: response regulator, partial [Lachnospiraceae bacterium]|nr:response regulator [Lachnospiraceae bacterium]